LERQKGDCIGLLAQLLIKDRNKRYLFYIVLDIITIIVFLILMLLWRHYWTEGFNACRAIVCSNATLEEATIKRQSLCNSTVGGLG
jgi:phosphoglycerol transferase MdoB-like AlkP superfamily enzyme